MPRDRVAPCRPAWQSIPAVVAGRRPGATFSRSNIRLAMAQVTFAHLSDVHLPPMAAFPMRHWNLKRVLGWLNWQIKRRHVHRRAALDAIVADIRAQAPGHILVSGDLVNIGLPAEYAAARDWLAALGPPETVFMVPGNHDIYCADTAADGIAAWAARMASNEAGAAVIAGVTRETGLTPAVRSGIAFPYVRIVGPVAVIGVNSAVPTAPGIAAGEVGSEQADMVAATLAALGRAGLFRLVMIHHPPLPGQASVRRGLADAERMADILADGAELAIHGHNHTITSVACGRCTVEGVASASAARPLHDEPAARYNLITVAGEVGGPFEVRLETRGLAKVEGAVGEAVLRIAEKRFLALRPSH